MLQNAYFPAKIGADTAENEQHFAEILPTVAFPEGRGFIEKQLEDIPGAARVLALAPAGRAGLSRKVR